MTYFRDTCVASTLSGLKVVRQPGETGTRGRPLGNAAKSQWA
jgi:hypothetical protein